MKFSEWKVLVFVICALKRKIRKKRQGGNLKDEICALSSESEHFIVRDVQKEMYGPEIQSLQGESSSLRTVLSFLLVLC